MQLRGDPLSAKGQLRLLLRLVGFFLRGIGYQFQNKKGHALECKLEAERIFGLLFERPPRQLITGVNQERDQGTRT
jgi:hypothetical protein